MRHVALSSVGRPAYFVARDEQRRTVVISVRGTHSSSDLLTDLSLDSCPFRTGLVLCSRPLLIENLASLELALVCRLCQ